MLWYRYVARTRHVHGPSVARTAWTWPVRPARGPHMARTWPERSPCDQNLPATIHMNIVTARNENRPCGKYDRSKKENRQQL